MSRGNNFMEVKKLSPGDFFFRCSHFGTERTQLPLPIPCSLPLSEIKQAQLKESQIELFCPGTYRLFQRTQLRPAKGAG